MFLPSLLRFKTRFRTSKSKAGFGLVELMVSISIMVVIMAVVLARHDRFDSVLLLRSQAYEIALQLREVQLSAVSASGRAGEYRENLGIYFSTNNPNRYILFQDSATGANANFRYDAGEEYGAPGIIDQRFAITGIRPETGRISGGGLSVIFERPNFYARFYDQGGQLSTSRVKIDIREVGTLGTDTDEVRSVEITSTGQISVGAYAFD